MNNKSQLVRGASCLRARQLATDGAAAAAAPPFIMHQRRVEAEKRGKVEIGEAMMK